MYGVVRDEFMFRKKLTLGEQRRVAGLQRLCSGHLSGGLSPHFDAKPPLRSINTAYTQRQTILLKYTVFGDILEYLDFIKTEN